MCDEDEMKPYLTEKMILVHNSLIIFFIVIILMIPKSIFADSFNGVNYTIIERSSRGNKISIDIKLAKKVSENDLYKLALKLRSAEPKSYNRVFISYYLPSMKSGSGAWAISHFDPNLEVRILGTTIDQEKKLVKSLEDLSGKIIGKWFDDSPAVSGTYTLLRRNGKIFLNVKYMDGSGSENEMIQKKHSGKRRFEKKADSCGEYFIIERNGNLDFYDKLGLIVSMRPLK